MASTGSAPAGESLLTRLPQSIRQRVYSFIGLDRAIVSSIHRYRPGCTNCPSCQLGPVAMQLFLVSQAVSKHAREYFYSRNVFLIIDEEERGMPLLRSLTPLALSSLRGVIVDFQPQYWQVPNLDDNETAEEFAERDNCLFHGYPRLVADWRRFCRQLAIHAPPNKLRLTVTAAVGSLRTTEVILRPLLQLPRVDWCSIKLGVVKDRRIQLFVEEVASKLTSPHDATAAVPFELNDLPAELHLLILEMTGVINPLFRLEWCEEKHAFLDAYCVNGCCTMAQNGLGCETTMTQVGFSSIGACWRAPNALLQVSQMVRRRMLYLLYTQHTFRVRVRWPYRRPVASQWAVNNSVFLVPIPRDGVRYLRRLRWVFPADLNPTAFLPGQPETEDLERAVGYLAEHAMLSHLTLILDFCDSLIDPEPDDGTGNAPNPDQDEFWRLYQRIAQLLCPLHGLKDMFVYVREPRGDGVVFEEHEITLEKMIMGPAYDSSARGKNLTENDDIWDDDYDDEYDGDA